MQLNSTCHCNLSCYRTTKDTAQSKVSHSPSKHCTRQVAPIRCPVLNQRPLSLSDSLTSRILYIPFYSNSSSLSLSLSYQTFLFSIQQWILQQQYFIAYAFRPFYLLRDFQSLSALSFSLSLSPPLSPSLSSFLSLLSPSPSLSLSHLHVKYTYLLDHSPPLPFSFFLSTFICHTFACFDLISRRIARNKLTVGGNLVEDGYG